MVLGIQNSASLKFLCWHQQANHKNFEDSKWAVKAVCDITPCGYKSVTCIVQGLLQVSPWNCLLCSLGYVLYFTTIELIL